MNVELPLNIVDQRPHPAELDGRHEIFLQRATLPFLPISLESLRELCDLAVTQVEDMLGDFRGGLVLEFRSANEALGSMVLEVPASDSRSVWDRLMGKPRPMGQIVTLLQARDFSQETLTHEFTHVWLSQHGLTPPRMICEGLASFVANQFTLDTATQTLLQQARTEPDIDSLEYDIFRSPDEQRGHISGQAHYAAGWAIVRYLVYHEQRCLADIARMKSFPALATACEFFDTELESASRATGSPQTKT